MAKSKKDTGAKPKQDAPSTEWTEAAAKTEVPEIIQSNQFHAPISERPAAGNTQADTKRLWRFVFLSIGLLALAVLMVMLLHERPVESAL